ncbi:MAG TPA: tetratricopeptide repeat protein [Kofleriaceae bacterium]|nr:tetratricopeptide repeat protein [Kofleriaceae bacterium]
MGTRSFAALAAAFVVVAVGLGAPRPAAADPKADMAQKSKEAMESYDFMDYDAAKKLLNQALAIAKKAKLEKDPVAAKVYLNLGLASFAGGDQEGAKAAFTTAVQIDPKIQIAPEYRSPALVKLLDQVRADAGVGLEPAEPAGPPGVDCTTVEGLQHTIIDTSKTNASQPIEALVGADVMAAKVSVMYRPEGAADFSESKLTKQGDCKYTGAIPASAMRGSVLHYYVAAYDANNRVIVGKGSSGSPNIMELTAGPPPRPDEEDPINGRKPAGDGGSVSGGVTTGGKPARIYLGVAGGTGFGYVTGKTEFDNRVENCCIGNSLVVITPELGYYVNPQLSIGMAARLGVPVGANLDGHSTLAPAGLVRVRYALAKSGEGVRVMGQLGAGILRNTIKLNNAADGMDTDIVAQGPLLLGAGVGYTKLLSGKVAFIADFSALGAIAVVDNLGSAPNLNSGLSADLSLGIAVGF